MAELTEKEAYSLAEFIDYNLLQTLRNDHDIDSLQWLRNIIHAYDKLSKYSDYEGLTDDEPM